MFAISVDPEQRLGLVNMHEAATGAHLIAANEALYSHPLWRPDYDEYWDCSRIKNFAVALEEVKRLVEMETDESEMPLTGDVVIVAAYDLVDMIAQLYAAMMEGQRVVKVCGSKAEAAAYLAPRTVRLPQLPAA